MADRVSKARQKGIVFLLATIILGGAVIAYFVVSQVGFAKQELDDSILFNARNEIEETYTNYFYSDQNIYNLNYNLGQLSQLLKRRAFTQGHTLNFCFITFDQDKNFVLGNFLGKECTYALNGSNQGTLADNSVMVLGSLTAGTDRIQLCDCNFDANIHKTTFLWDQLSSRQAEITLRWFTGLDVGEFGAQSIEASCSDNIQNQGENGVDCGGPCPSCPPVILQTTYESGSCGAGKTAIASMTDLTNTHAGIVASHNIKICVKADLPGCTITADTGTCIFEMAATSNAHIAECASGYPQTIRATASCGTLVCAYKQGANPCAFDENALASMAASVNAHIATGGYYNRKICCKIS